MTARKKAFESELIVTNVSSKDDKVILSLRFVKPRFKETPKRRLEEVIEPLPKSGMEKAGREIAKGYASVFQKQINQIQRSTPFLRPPLPHDTIQITLSKEEYVEMGRPTIDDKIVLKLRMRPAF